MNILKLMHSYLLVACFVILPSCSSQRSAVKEQKPGNCLGTPSNPQPSDSNASHDAAPWITVWVHGTQPSFEKAPGKRLRAFLQKHAYELVYPKKGLHPISIQPEKNRYHTIARLLHEVDPVRFTKEHFYTFGWSGDLNFTARYEAGKALYRALAHLIDEFEHTHGTKPRIRLITHSHGGNVALNLVCAQEEYKKDLVIDELVLLACPIQEKTACFAQDALFKKIYSLYSSLDLLQVVDPQGLYKRDLGQNKPTSAHGTTKALFSQRRFPVCYHKVVQAKIRFNKRAILHIEFLSDRFVRALPNIITALETWQQSNIYDTKAKQICITKDTGHTKDLRCSYAYKPIQ